MAEGAPLLREYGRKSIEGSNPSLSASSLLMGVRDGSKNSEKPKVLSPVLFAGVRSHAPTFAVEVWAEVWAE